MNASPHTVTMPGQVWGLAAATATGPLFATSYASDDFWATTVSAVDLDGTLLWQRDFAGHPQPPRATAEGTVWIAHDGPSGPALTELARDGSVAHEVTPEHEQDEHIGVFVVLPDGFCVLWLSRRPHPPQSRAGHAARVARHDAGGRRLWSTPVRLDRMSWPGVVEAGVSTDWQVRPKQPWTPASIQVCHRNPLLVSGDRVAATLVDGSGLGVTFFLDTETGRLVAATAPAPGQYKAILAPGEFLLGFQGYDAFSTTSHNVSGSVVQGWPSNVMPLVDRHGGIRGPESENRLPSRSRFRGLGQDGSLRDGPPLSGYYTTYPALDRDGTAVFWRDGKLLTVDAGFLGRELFARPDDRGVMSRVLLLAGGQVVFALDSELLFFRDTGLGPLDAGPWPCGDGNLNGNPVAYR